MLTNKDSMIIVRSTIALGHDLGLKVIAEGVENQAMLDRLAALGCDVAQGYYIGKPMPRSNSGSGCGNRPGGREKRDRPAKVNFHSSPPRAVQPELEAFIRCEPGSGVPP